MPVETLGVEFVATGFEALQRQLQEQQAEIARLEGIYRRSKQAIDDYTNGIRGASLSDEQRTEKVKELQATMYNANLALADMRVAQYDTAEAAMAMATAEGEAAGETKVLSDETKDAEEESSGFSNFISNTLAVALGGILVNAIEMAISAVGSLVGELRGFIDDALEAEKAVTSLEQTIKSTGGAAGLTSEAALDLAAQFRDLYGGSHEAVMAVEEIGLTMGTISANEMPAFIQTVADLGAKMGKVELAARLMAQAQEDPVSVLTRLRRMGILFSESLEEQIKALAETGDKAGAYALVMDRVSEATSGAATAMANTTSGKMEILQEHFSETGKTIMETFLPVIASVADTLLSALDSPAVQSAISSMTTSLGNMVDSISPALINMISSAFSWGFNLISSFAEGIEYASNLVVGAVDFIGSIVSSLMAPGSPPKFLPDIGQWGTDTMDMYLAGFTQADFSIFDDIGNMIEAFVRATTPDETPAMFSAIIKSREALAAAMSEGESAAETLADLGDIVGELPDEIQSYVTSLYNLSAASEVAEDAQARLDAVDDLTLDNAGELTAMFSGALLDSVKRYIGSLNDLASADRELEDAQSALNSTTKKYDDALAPLNEELARMKATQQEIEDKKEIAEWTAVLGNKYATEAQKEKARAAIREIEIKRQIAGLEAQKTREIAAAKGRVDAAKDTQEATKKLADSQKASMVTLAQQERDLAKAIEDSAKTAVALAQGKIKAAQEYNKIIEEQAGIMKRAEEEQIKAQERAAKESEKLFKEAQKNADAAADAERNYNYTMADRAGKLAILRDELSKATVGSADYYKILTEIYQLEHQKEKAPKVDPEVLKTANERLEELKRKAAAIQAPATAPAQPAGAGPSPLAAISGSLDNLMSPSGPLSGVVTFWQENGGKIQQSMQDMFGTVSSTLSQIGKDVGPLVKETLQKLGDWFDRNGPNITKWVDNVGSRMKDLSDGVKVISDVVLAAWNIIKPIFEALVNIILDVAELMLSAAVGDWAGAWEAIKKVVSDAWEGIKKAFVALADWVSSWFGTSWNDVTETWRGNWEKLKEIVRLAWDKVTGSFDSVKESIGKKMTEISDSISGKWEEIKKTVSDSIGGTKTNVDNITSDIRDGWTAKWAEISQSTTDKWNEINTNLSDKFSELLEWLGVDEDEMKRKWGDILEGMRLIAVEVWRRINEWITTTMGNIASTISTKINEAKTSLENAWNSMVTTATAKATEIYTAVTGKIAEIGTWITAQWETIKGWGANIITAISEGISSVAHKIGDAISDAVSAVSMTVGPVFEKLKAIGTDVIAGIGKGITDAWSDVATALTTAFESVKTSLAEAGTALYDALISIGTKIIDMITEGIKSSAKGFITYVTGIIEQAIRDILDRLGIPWPGGDTSSQSVAGDMAGDYFNSLLVFTSQIYDSVRGTNVLLADIYNAMRSQVEYSRGGASQIVNNYYNTSRTNNLTTQSYTRAGGLALEFATMDMVSR
jgi:phage-related protein